MKIIAVTRKIEWIFFDLDGTLADSVECLYQVYRDFLVGLHIPVNEKDLAGLNGFSLPEIIHFIKTTYGLSHSGDELLSMYKNNVRKAYATKVLPMPGADKVLQTLREKFRLQLVTSGEKTEAMSFIKQLGWNNLLNSYIFGDDVSKGKPDPEIYQLAITRSGSPGNSIIVIEDSFNGVKASVAAGLTTIGFAPKGNGQSLTDAGAADIIFKLDDLISLAGLTQ